MEKYQRNWSRLKLAADPQKKYAALLFKFYHNLSFVPSEWILVFTYDSKWSKNKLLNNNYYILAEILNLCFDAGFSLHSKIFMFWWIMQSHA